MPGTPAQLQGPHDRPTQWPPSWPVCTLRTPQGDTAAISLHGAQVLSWRTAHHDAYHTFQERERLYLSSRINWQAVAQGRSAIRGGIPICWPQFNRRGPLPKHGVARLLPWKLQAQTADSATLRLRHTDVPPHLLHSQPKTAGEPCEPLWLHAFEATLLVKLTAGSLSLRLRVRNTGNNTIPFTTAFHGYLATAQIAQTRITGAEDIRYRDARPNANPSHPVQQGPIRFAGEVDRVYPAFGATLTCGDASVRSQQSASLGQTVIWIPHAALCARLLDLPPYAWQHFVCIEAAQIDAPVLLEPGAIWQGWQTFEAN
ncbi:MAG: D-hexose-6-phosphate mutarotase [Brachymonas sp.]|nr:D-hexose-6-phosphate mutarotase [Brachymonas sp.]